MPRVCLVVSVDDVTTPTGLVRRRHTMHDSTCTGIGTILFVLDDDEAAEYNAHGGDLLSCASCPACLPQPVVVSLLTARPEPPLVSINGHVYLLSKVA